MMNLCQLLCCHLVSGCHHAGFDVFRRCRVTLPCHRTRMDLIKATGQYGKVQPWTEGSMPIPADRDSDLQLTPSQRWWEFNQYQMALQNAAAVVHAAEGGHSAAPRMPGQAVVSAVTVQQQKPTGRRRRKGTYSSTALQAAIGTSLVGADQVQQQQLLLDPQQQQQQQRDVGVQARVPRVPRKYFFWPNILIEMLLQRPDVKGAEEGYIWQQMIMVSQLWVQVKDPCVEHDRQASIDVYCSLLLYFSQLEDKCWKLDAVWLWMCYLRLQYLIRQCAVTLCSKASQATAALLLFITHHYFARYQE